MYDAQVEGIDKALEAEDGTRSRRRTSLRLQSQGSSGLDKAIWLFPIEKIVPVLQQLYTQRQQIKQVIFEINGIADIMRQQPGQRNPRRPGTQEPMGHPAAGSALKGRGPFLARDCLRITAEISVNKFGIDTISQMTGLNHPGSRRSSKLNRPCRHSKPRCRRNADGAGAGHPASRPAAAT